MGNLRDTQTTVEVAGGIAGQGLRGTQVSVEIARPNAEIADALVTQESIELALAAPTTVSKERVTQDSVELAIQARSLNSGQGIISIGVMSSPDNLSDDLWAIVNRGPIGYTMEKFDSIINTDASSQQDLGGKFSAVAGLGYLASQTVDVVGDGAYLGQFIVPPNGVLVLPHAVRVIEVGLHYESNLLSLPIEQKGGMNSQGYLKRFSKLWVRILNTVNLVINGERVSFRKPSMLMDTGVPPQTEDVKVHGLGSARVLQWKITQDQPLPCDILAVFGDLEIGEN